jgi:hypothetical protein
LIWEKVATWIEAPTLTPVNWSQIDDLCQLFIEMGNNRQQTIRPGVRSMVMLTSWEISKESNNCVFKKVSRTPLQVLSAIQDEARKWICAGNKDLEMILPMHAQPAQTAPNGMLA